MYEHQNDCDRYEWNLAGWTGTARFVRLTTIFDELEQRDIRFVVTTGNKWSDAKTFWSRTDESYYLCRSQWRSNFRGEDKIVEQHWDSRLVRMS